MAKITIVDENDQIIGSEDQKVAEEKGNIFRLVRIFVTNSKGQILLQRRSPTKRIQPNKWDQSAGGHVDEGEDYLTAARREVFEELGIENPDLEEITKYYKESMVHGLNHKKFNMVYKMIYDGEIIFKEDEIAEVKWFTRQELDELVKTNPDNFTLGFLDSYEILKNSS